MLTQQDIVTFCDSHSYDLRVSGNGRWIDQKCTPDVLWSISDFVIEYVDNVRDEFTVKDIWQSDYAKQTIADTYSKPGTDDETAAHEYDKVFSQPLCMLDYAGVLEDISTTKRHRYRVRNRDVLEYIARNDLNALRFIQIYVEKVLRDSDLFPVFWEFFDTQDSAHFNAMKRRFIYFYHEFTPIKKDYEPKRIFTKVLNPLAVKYSKRGTESGRLSSNIITRADLMYNRDNFRDLYRDKPKGISREDWRAAHPEFDIRPGYFVQMMNASKRNLRDYIVQYRNNTSELTMYVEQFSDRSAPTQIHHIFPRNEFPTIMHYMENLIALTPNQHFGFAHPNNNTHVVDLMAQRDLLIAKTYSIKSNIENAFEDNLYTFNNLLTVLREGWGDDDVMTISEGDYPEVIRSIQQHYDNNEGGQNAQMSLWSAESGIL